MSSCCLPYKRTFSNLPGKDPWPSTSGPFPVTWAIAVAFPGGTGPQHASPFLILLRFASQKEPPPFFLTLSSPARLLSLI